MDFVRAITYPFDDEEWLKKLGLGFLIALIPVVGVMTLYGWMLEITKRVKMNDPQPLPDWSDFGEYLRKGFMLFLGVLIYTLPVILLSFLSSAPSLFMDENNGGLLMTVTICCSCLSALLGIAISVFSLVGIIRYAESENFSVFFAFSENYAILRENIGDFGMAILYLVGFSLLVSIASTITFGLGTIVAIPLTVTFFGHLLGQLARKLSGTGAVPAV